MTTQHRKFVYSQVVTMILDPVMRWIEICRVLSARKDLLSYQVEQPLLTRYSLPSKVIVD